jgi:hypothetical protein
MICCWLSNVSEDVGIVSEENVPCQNIPCNYPNSTILRHIRPNHRRSACCHLPKCNSYHNCFRREPCLLDSASPHAYSRVGRSGSSYTSSHTRCLGVRKRGLVSRSREFRWGCAFRPRLQVPLLLGFLLSDQQRSSRLCLLIDGLVRCLGRCIDGPTSNNDEVKKAWGGTRGSRCVNHFGILVGCSMWIIGFSFVSLVIRQIN